LLARASARKALAGIRHLAIDASAPPINAGSIALAANAGLVVRLAQIVHFRFPLLWFLNNQIIGRNALGSQALSINYFEAKKNPPTWRVDLVRALIGTDRLASGHH
jgi:hypothetical protein